MGNVLVLDFDGVISNSIGECFINSYRAFHEWNSVDDDFLKVDQPEMEKLFIKYRYLVGPAYEYYCLWKTIEECIERPDLDFVERYQNQKQNSSQKLFEEFSERFFGLRNAFRKKNLEQWIDLNPLYPGILSFLEYIEKKYLVFIASTKDEESIDLILKNAGFTMQKNNIFGKKFSTDKFHQLNEIIRKTGSFPEKVSFIDDNADHLKRVSPIGIHCYLAMWGYCAPELDKVHDQMTFTAMSLNSLRSFF